MLQMHSSWSLMTGSIEVEDFAVLTMTMVRAGDFHICFHATVDLTLKGVKFIMKHQTKLLTLQLILVFVYI